MTTPSGGTVLVVNAGSSSLKYELVDITTAEHTAVDALNNARKTPAGAHELSDWCHSKLAEHSAYIREHLEDPPEISSWTLAEPRSWPRHG